MDLSEVLFLFLSQQVCPLQCCLQGCLLLLRLPLQILEEEFLEDLGRFSGILVDVV